MEVSALLQDNEEIIVIVRRHWIVLFGTFMVMLAVAVVPLSVLLLTDNLSVFVLHLFWFLYAILITLLWVFSGFSFADYLLDAWIVTDKRIIDIEQTGLFNRRVKTIPLEKIQNIVIEVSGLNQTVLRMGSVIIETAGEHTNCIIPDAPYPEEVKQIILEAASRTNL